MPNDMAGKLPSPTPAKPAQPAQPAKTAPAAKPAAPAPAAAPPPFDESMLLKPMNVAGLRKRIYDNVYDSLKNAAPVENTRYRLKMDNLQWADPEDWSPAHQKKTFFQGGTLARRLQGDWVLEDVPTNKEVSRKRATIASVPHLNNRGLFLLNGSHWSLSSQTRLDPGVYPRIQANGDIEAYVNPKNGRQHRLAMDPESGAFHMEIGQAKIPLMPILRTMGITDRQMSDAWGHDILSRNNEKSDPSAVRKLISKFYDSDRMPEGKTDRELLEDKFHKMELDPYVTNRTMGTAHDRYDAATMLNATKHLLAMNKGEKQPAERDHQAFQHIMGQEHIFGERAKNIRPLLSSLLWKATGKGNLDHVPSGYLNPHLNETITGTGLGINAQMTNPAEMLDSLYRVTKMGAGGIGSLESVPAESRNVHSSQFHFIDPVVTPESGKAGVDLRFGSGSARGTDGKLYSRFLDATGKPTWMTPRDTQGKTVGSWESRDKAGLIPVMKDGVMHRVSKDKVDIWSPPMEHGFSPIANLIPFKSASPPQRTAMGARMTTQALPLIGAETPHVQAGRPEGGSYEHHYGEHFGAIRAKGAGKVSGVTPDAVKVRYQDGTQEEFALHKHELYDHSPGRKTHFTQTPVVKQGDIIQPGQLIAHSNYTDKEGRVALGMNARTAWLPARGGGAFEDAFAISESFANRMTSDHMALHSIEDNEAKFGKKEFRSLFPTKFEPGHIKELDDNGVVKPGTIVKPGQPLILAARKVTAPRTTLVRSPKPVWQDMSEVWDHEYPGEVVDAIKTRNGWRVSVKSAVPTQESDKMSARHGNKGIVTIVPDHQMPTGEDGKPFEVLVSPYTLNSRKNDSQIAETILAKIAAKTGKKYELPDFHADDLMQFAKDEAAKHQMPMTETVHDPVTGTKIPGVLTGSQYFMKLHHSVEGKLKERDTGGYDSFDSPARGGEGGAKRMALSDTFALLAHRALDFLHGTKMVRGQRNEHWWEATMSGYTPPTPTSTKQYQRFVEGLRASGINPVVENGKMRLMALTDEAVDRLAEGRELANPRGIDWAKGGDPVPGGLFDKKLHGEDGSRYSKLSLFEPMPNPAFEDPVRYTLGLTEKQMRNVIAGKGGMIAGKYAEPVQGEPTPRTYMTGPKALHEALKNIDVDRELAKVDEDIRGTKKTKRDAAIRRRKYLQGAKDQGIHPGQWMMSKVPVLPPMFRPVSKMQGSNTELVSDPNYLYADLFNANNNLKSLHGKVEDLSEERLATYDALKAVSGLGDPINPKHQQKNVKGMLKLLLAESPKWSIVQHKLLSSPVDLVGRSTVSPDANLDMDEVGIPKSMANKVYSRFVIKRLVKGGMSPVEAVKAVQDSTPEADRALDLEMKERPVSYHRAPVLHKYGHIGAWPKLVKGDGIRVSPFVIKGLGMDFDGDTANIHVPVYPNEVKDIVDKMMPSKNLLSAKDFAPHYKPEREFHVGLWQATQQQEGQDHKRERVFEDSKALRRAFESGEIGIHDKVVVMKH